MKDYSTRDSALLADDGAFSSGCSAQPTWSRLLVGWRL